MNRDKKKKIIRAIRRLWASLNTHLEWAAANTTKTEQKVAGGPVWHKARVREYLSAIKELTECL